MKTCAKKNSLKKFNKLSTSRICSRTHSFGNSSNSANSLFGLKKNVVVTYSKSKPIHVLKKYHFQSPDTPRMSTPDSLQTTGKELEINPQDESKNAWESHTTSKIQISLKDCNKLLTPKSLVKPTLALRDISNIPIDKTLCRTQCTPRQEDSQVIPPSESVQPLKAKKNLTPFNGKSKGSRFPKPNERKKLLLAPLKLSEDDEALNSQFSASEDKQIIASLFQSEEDQRNQFCLGRFTLEQPNKETTNYSIKSMSTDFDSKVKSDQSQVNTLTSLRSMSFCTMIEARDKGDSEQPINHNNLQEESNINIQYKSTLNEENRVQVEDFITQPLSPIQEVEKVDENNEDNLDLLQTIILQNHQPKHTKELLLLNTPRSGTLVEHRKQNAEPIDKDFIHSAIIDEQESSTNIEELLSKDVPRTSTPIEQGKRNAISVDKGLIQPIVKPDTTKQDLSSTDSPWTSTPRDQEGNINAIPIDRGSIKSSMDEQETQDTKQDLKCTEIPRTSTPIDKGKTNLTPNDKDLHNPSLEHKPQSTKQDIVCIDAPRTSTPIDQGKTDALPIDEPEISPIAKVYDHDILLRKSEIIQLKSTREKEKQDKGINNETDGNARKSIIAKSHEKILKNSKNMSSLPLQASMSIEDDSDKESLPENITPEVIPAIKSECSSSKRKLEYSMAFKPNKTQCILQEFPCTLKKSCNYKVWIKRNESQKDFTVKTNHTFPLDILTK